MSSSSVPLIPPDLVTEEYPLTTIFEPPSGCFGVLLPTAFDPQSCTTSASTEYCYWPKSDSCYPPDRTVAVNDILYGSSTFPWTAAIFYSPGLLPLGFQTNLASTDASTSSYACGCPSGWTAAFVGCGWCGAHPTGTNSAIVVLQPVVIAFWESSDLPRFTPASAPLLPRSVIEAFVASPTSSRLTFFPATPSANSTSTSTSTKKAAHTSTQEPHTSTIQADHKKSKDTGNTLSTGAKAGIGVGVAVLAVLLLALGFWLLRRKKPVGNRASLRRSGSARQYIGSKDEYETGRSAQPFREVPEL